MTSRNLYFKLMREDLKSRLWAVTLISLGFFFTFPVAAAFQAGEIENASNQATALLNYTNLMDHALSFDNGLTAFLMMVLAMICGMSSFSYLNSRSKVDFYHSIPIRRELLYVVNFIDGILITAVPYAISVFLAVAVGIANHADATRLWPMALVACGLHLVYFILMYSVVIIAAMMTGSLGVGILASLVFAFYIPLAVALVQGFFGIFFKTYVWESGAALVRTGVRISPVMEYVYQTEEYSQGTHMLPAALMALAIAVILALAGLLLYRRRPSEAAGKAMAFPVTCPTIRILIVLLSGIGLGSFFWSMRESTGWFVFGVLCGTIISHCVIEIIYHFDFKRLFDHKGQLIACGLVSLAVMSIFRYDLLGYDKYVPAADQVRSSAVSVDVLNSWTSYGSVDQRQDGTYYWKYANGGEYIYDHMEYQDTENLLKLASYCVGYVNEKEQLYAGDLVQVNIRYTLNSGRHVYRSYHVPIGEIEPMVNNMYADSAFQQAAYPLMARTPDEVAVVRYKDNTGTTRLDRLTAEEKKELLESYQQEFQNATLDQMKSEYPLGLIRFSTEKDEEGLKQLNRDHSREDRYSYYELEEMESRDYYPVYPSFTKTRALLQQQKVWTGNDMEKLNITSINIGKDITDKDREAKVRSDLYATEETRMTVTIDDPAELEALKKILVYEGRTYYNPMYQAEVLEVEVLTEQNGEVQSYPALFPEGSIPDFVEQKMTDSVN